MRFRAFLSLCFTFLLFVDAHAQSPHWESRIADIDSLVQIKSYDSVLSLGNDIIREMQEIGGLTDSAYGTLFYRVGAAFFKAEHYESAESLLIASLNKRKEIFTPPHLEIAQSEQALANFCNMRGWRDKADAYYKSALEAYRALLDKDDPALIGCWSQYAVHLKNLGLFDESVSELRKILAVLERSSHEVGDLKANVLWNLSTVCCHQGKYADALECNRQIYDILSGLYGDTCLRCIRIRNNIALNYVSMQQNADAIREYKDLIPLAERQMGLNNHYIGLIMYNLADIYLETGDYLRAESLFTQAAGVFVISDGPVSHDLARCKFSLGDLYVKLGNYPLAESQYKESVDMIDSTFWYWEYRGFVTTPLRKLAHLYTYQRRWNEAERLYLRGIGIHEHEYGRNHIWTAEDLIELSFVYEKQQRYDTAIAICREALETYKANYGEDHIDYAEAQKRLAEIYTSKRDFSQAIAIYNSIAEVLKDQLGEEHIAVADILCRLGDCHGHLNMFAQAESEYSKALNIYSHKLPEDNPIIANTLVDRADLYIRQRDYPAAEADLSRAYGSYSDKYGSFVPEMGKIRRLLAIANGLSGNYSQALTYYREHISSRRQFLDKMFVGTSEDQKLRWIEITPPLESSLISLALKGDDDSLTALALEMVMASKGAVVDAVMKERENSFCSGDAFIDADIAAMSTLNTIITNLAISGISSSPTPSSGDTLQTLISRRDSIESVLSQSCQAFAEEHTSRDISYGEVAAALPPHAVLWEFIKYHPMRSDDSVETRQPSRQRYAAFTVNTSGDVAIIDIGLADSLDILVNKIRSDISASAEYFDQALYAALEIGLKTDLARLSDKVCAPLLHRMSSETRIIISPDGQLNLLPFEILVTGAGDYLVENYTISYMTSGRDLLPIPYTDSRDIGTVAVILADPDFNASNATSTPEVLFPDQISNGSARRGQAGCLTTSFSPLTGSRREAVAIAEILRQSTPYQVREYYYSDASESRLKSLETAPAILHIATHGFFCPDTHQGADNALDNPMFRCGIVLAGANMSMADSTGEIEGGENGIVTAYELSGVNLIGTRLVAISACESGTGDAIAGEGVFGLRRALRHAGARNTLMSLWNIPDKETAQLMSAFYRHWGAGNSPAAAFDLAIRELIASMRNSYGHSHPFFWGGFILTGNPE